MGQPDAPSFKAQLQEYKQAIDADIAAYAKQLQAETLAERGRYPAEVEVAVFLDMLARGGKRFRGTLVMVGYKMCGGQNRQMILEAARAIEMLHAYILIIDDIQDRAKLRRGKPSAHEMIASYHKEHNLKGDPAHAGISLALMGALAGAHDAQQILAGLDADPQLRLKAITLVNRTMMVTAHGQTLDIMNELLERPDPEDVDRVLQWKSGEYTITNPLQLGMVLAGASDETLQAVVPFTIHAGKAFQITDDILGIYGDEQTVGKTPGDDIREGKGTVLSLYALEHAAPADRELLERCLGNPHITAHDLEECRRIITDSGALAHAEERATQHVHEALAALDKITGLWSDEGTTFLRELAHLLQDRVS
jgi:geranylgeranyl diphosphate synthase type I